MKWLNFQAESISLKMTHIFLSFLNCQNIKNLFSIIYLEKIVFTFHSSLETKSCSSLLVELNATRTGGGVKVYRPCDWILRQWKKSKIVSFSLLFKSKIHAPEINKSQCKLGALPNNKQETWKTASFSYFYFTSYTSH